MHPTYLEVFGTDKDKNKIVTTDLVKINNLGLTEITVGVVYTNPDGSILKGEYSYLICEKEFPGMTLVEWPLPPAPIVSPNMPSDLEARHLESSVELLWIDRDSQITPTTFEIQSSQDSGVWMQENVVSEGTVSYIVKGTNPLAKYDYRIRAINMAGTSDWATVHAEPFVYPPDQPTSNIGTVIKPGTDISKLHKLTNSQSYIAEDGEYTGNSIESDIVIVARNKGMAVFKGNGSFAAKGATNVSLIGITFHFTGSDTQDNSFAAVLPGQGWKLIDCVAEGALGVGIGVMKVSGCRLTRVVARANGRAGIGGTSVSDTILQSCESRANNKKGDPNGGGGKWTRVNGLTVNDHLSRDNNGPGFWLDYNNINVTINRGEFCNNIDYYNGSTLKAGGSGIFFEISGVKDKTSTWGLLLLDGVYAHDNRVGISSSELKASTNEDVNWRSCANCEARNCRIGRMIISGAEGKRTESADAGNNINIHDNKFLQKLMEDGRFGKIITKGKVLQANNVVVGSLN